MRATSPTPGDVRGSTRDRGGLLLALRRAAVVHRPRRPAAADVRLLQAGRRVRGAGRAGPAQGKGAAGG